MERAELEAEYIAARALYAAAMERLRLAKAALAQSPPPPVPRKPIGPAGRLRGAAREQRDDRIGERYRAGATIAALAAEFGISEGRIRVALAVTRYADPSPTPVFTVPTLSEAELARIDAFFPNAPR